MEMLTFYLFLFSMCTAVETGPSNVSSQLAHSQQLATSEEDAVEMTGGRGPGRGVSEEDVDVFTIEEEDEDEEDDDGAMEAV